MVALPCPTKLYGSAGLAVTAKVSTGHFVSPEMNQVAIVALSISIGLVSPVVHLMIRVAETAVNDTVEHVKDSTVKVISFKSLTPPFDYAAR